MKSTPLPVNWDINAKNSLKKLVQYISKDSPQNAQHVKKTLLKLGNSLGKFPNKFPQELLYEDVPGNYRSVSKWSWKLVYEVTSKAVTILQLIDTRQYPAKLKLKFRR